MAKKTNKEAKAFPDGRLVLQYCGTHGFRESARYYDVSRGWIYGLKNLYPTEYATMQATKRAAGTSKPSVTRLSKRRASASAARSTQVSGNASASSKSQSPSVGARIVPPSTKSVADPLHPSQAVKASNKASGAQRPKVGSAFLRRGQSLNPLEFKHANPAVQVVIFGIYFDELRRRSKHGQWSRDVKNVFHLHVRTAQRYRRLAVALTKKLGVFDQCNVAVSTDKKFPPKLQDQLSDAVADSTVRQLYLKYFVRP